MPVYNASKFLNQAIQSILNQSFRDFELIILDDCSTDQSVDIASAFEDDRIAIYREDSNKGIVFQLNKGLDISKASLVARMDADDIAYPERFEIQKQTLDNNLNISVVGSSVDIIDERGDNLRTHILSNKEESFLFTLCQLKNPVYHPSVMYKKKFVMVMGGYRASYPHMEDFDLWLRVLHHGGRIVNIEQPLLKYRLHDQQISAEHRQVQQSGLNTFLRGSLNKSLFTDAQIQWFLDVVRWKRHKATNKEQAILLIQIWQEVLKHQSICRSLKSRLASQLFRAFIQNEAYIFSTIDILRLSLQKDKWFVRSYLLNNLSQRFRYKLGVD